ncbi:T9SS type A sorting domain-containing protein [Marnyiella aurantia]|uniref:T9SS type A sorting domain-containing protein n=1 Tax=Marnyiella aurantia TaxID=2758037 RepID=A0A7D7QYK2_9FLAO|nr:T9SS type A sorting domain-containing protein [Marnyiella aurantia]MBA5246254.1 T9SS type A sorting domain-containing protein [Marnyiella aurantia]QMS98371.1 T9SS type A sorting domain-containing protein [Marnyiella aurantia]
MKKVLSSLLLTSATMMMFGQVILNENFNALNNGNLGTNVAGTAAGQNGWFTLGGANADYQVTTIDAAHGKSMQIIGSNSYNAITPALNGRLAAQLTSAVANAGNNIVQVKFELYTGNSTGAGAAQMRVWGMDGATSRTIGGYYYDFATKTLYGLATLNNLVAPVFPATTPALGPWTFTYNLTAGPGVILTANTWYTLIYEYNKTTGVSTWRHPGGSGSTPTTGTTSLLMPGMTAEDIYFYNNSAPTNTVSNVIGVDNIMAQFGTAGSLSTDDVVNTVDVKGSLAIYPNPTSDILNIKTESKINAVSVVDMTGRKINVKVESDKVDVSALPVGTYLINVETKDGISTEKFIKK